MKKKIKKTLAFSLASLALLSAGSIGVFAQTPEDETTITAESANYTYIENHSKIDCANYYIDGYYYNFLIKIPNGASLDSVTLYDIYGDEYINLGQLVNTGYQQVVFQYSNNDGDFYMFKTYVMSGVPEYVWEHFGIKLYYDSGSEHYMATNNANNSIIEGPGYILNRS